MKDYRAFFVGKDGRITDRFDLWCDNEDEAKERAKALIDDGYDVELWHRNKKIAVYKHETQATPPRLAGAVGKTVPSCLFREDEGWICENHPDQPFSGPHACRCGGAGMPCPLQSVEQGKSAAPAERL